jgi:hypothetical protein
MQKYEKKYIFRHMKVQEKEKMGTHEGPKVLKKMMST